jgi:hypothetical protein
MVELQQDPAFTPLIKIQNQDLLPRSPALPSSLLLEANWTTWILDL